MVGGYKKKTTKRSLRPRRTIRKRTAKTSAMVVAKRALRLASVATKSTSEVKHFSYYDSNLNLTNSLVANNYGYAAYAVKLTTTGPSWEELFDCGPLRGNKAYLKYLTGNWSINMYDEEDAVNFTVAVIKKKADMDGADMTSAIELRAGQALYDFRRIKVLYYKKFQIYPGGSLGGDRSGTVIKQGKFFIPVNKMIRFQDQGSTGQQHSEPMSNQDQYFFLVHTDNVGVDLEHPKLTVNLRSCWRDTDIN